MGMTSVLEDNLVFESFSRAWILFQLLIKNQGSGAASPILRFGSAGSPGRMGGAGRGERGLFGPRRKGNELLVGLALVSVRRHVPILLDVRARAHRRDRAVVPRLVSTLCWSPFYRGSLGAL